MIRAPARLAAAAVLVSLFAGCGGSNPAMTREDARAFAREALERVGFEDVTVERGVASGQSDDPPAQRTANEPVVDVWKTTSRAADGGTAEIWVQRRSGSAVFLRDVGPQGGPLLSDEQARELADFRWNPAADRRRDRLLGPSIAAAILVTLVWAGLVGATRSPLSRRLAPEARWANRRRQPWLGGRTGGANLGPGRPVPGVRRRARLRRGRRRSRVGFTSRRAGATRLRP